MSYSSVEAHAKEYFWSLSPLAKRVASDVAAARDAYEDLWITLSLSDQKQVVDDAIIRPDAALKYSFCPRGRAPVEYFPRLRLQTGGRIVSEEDGKVSWRDEHSAPFSFMTRSQLNLSLSVAEPTSHGSPRPPTEGFIDPPSVVLGGSSTHDSPPPAGFLTRLRNKSAVLKIQALARPGDLQPLISPGGKPAPEIVPGIENKCPALKPSTVKLPAPKQATVKSPAPKPATVKSPAPKPATVKSPAPKPATVKSPAPKPATVKSPAPKPATVKTQLVPPESKSVAAKSVEPKLAAPESKFVAANLADSKVVAAKSADSKVVAAKSADSKVVAAKSADSKVVAAKAADSKLVATKSADSKLVPADPKQLIQPTGKGNDPRGLSPKRKPRTPPPPPPGSRDPERVRLLSPSPEDPPPPPPTSNMEGACLAALQANLSLESLQEFHSALNSPTGSVTSLPKTGFDFLDNW